MVKFAIDCQLYSLFEILDLHVGADFTTLYTVCTDVFGHFVPIALGFPVATINRMFDLAEKSGLTYFRRQASQARSTRRRFRIILSSE